MASSEDKPRFGEINSSSYLIAYAYPRNGQKIAGVVYYDHFTASGFSMTGVVEDGVLVFNSGSLSDVGVHFGITLGHYLRHEFEEGPDDFIDTHRLSAGLEGRLRKLSNKVKEKNLKAKEDLVSSMTSLCGNFFPYEARHVSED